MSPKVADVMGQVRQLSENERCELAVELLDEAVELDIAAAWTEEARRRVAEIDAGRVETLSTEEALRIIAVDD